MYINLNLKMSHDKKLSKKSYVIHKCIQYLLDNNKYEENIFTPDFNKLTSNDYLNQVVRHAHKIHYKKICSHNIEFETPEKNYFIDDSSIHSSNGWFEYDLKVVYNEQGEEITEPCCNKRFFTGVSDDILKFNNSLNFSLNTKICLCQDNIEYEN
jgi:hypothetical protein